MNPDVGGIGDIGDIGDIGYVKYIDAKDCVRLNEWLQRLEIYQHQGVTTLAIQNYDILVSQYGWLDELIVGWFPNCIGISRHYCFGRADSVYVLGMDSITRIFLYVPAWLFRSCSNVALRRGRYIFLPTNKRLRIVIPGQNSWNGKLKTLLSCLLFDIFSLEYANKSSRSAAYKASI